MARQKLFGVLVGQLHRIPVILGLHNFHVRVLPDDAPGAQGPVLMAGRAGGAYQKGHLTRAPQLLTQRPGQVGPVLVVVGVAHVGDAPAAVFLGGVGAGEGHHLVSLVQQGVDGRSYRAHVRHVYADYVEPPPGGLSEPPELVLGGDRDGGQVLVVDGHAHLLVLPGGVLHAQGHRVPPGMDHLISKVKVVLGLAGAVAVQAPIKPNRAFRAFRPGLDRRGIGWAGQAGLASAQPQGAYAQRRQGKGAKVPLGVLQHG